MALCCIRKVKNTDVLTMEEVLSGWVAPDEVKGIGAILQRGGRPGPWAGNIPVASAEVLLRMLNKVEYNEEAPLRGTRESLWICAEAWKERNLAVAKANAQTAQQTKQLQDKEKELRRMQCIMDKTVMCLSQLIRAARNRSSRKVDAKQVRSFVAGMSEDWDPEGWDGDIWGDDPDERLGPLPDPPPVRSIYPSLKQFKKMQPVTRRHQVQGIADMRQMVDAQGQPVIGANGRPVMEPVLEMQEQRLIQEDFTQDEVTLILSRYKQRPGEALDTWLLRLADDGADAIAVDSGDCVRFSGMSSDPSVNTEYRIVGRLIGDGESLPLCLLYAMAAHEVYPTPGDWPLLTGTWHTLRDAAQQMARLCLRESVSRDSDHFINDKEVSKRVWDAIIRDSPPQYRSAVLTVLLGAQDLTCAAVRMRLMELAGLGDWGMTASEPSKLPQTREERKPFVKKSGSGATRTEMWKALIKAGVPAEEIDGIPTNALMEKCRQKGIQVRCNMAPRVDLGVADLVAMLKEVVRPPPTAPPRSRVEDQSDDDSSDLGEEERYVAAVSRKQTKKQRKKEKRDRRRRDREDE
ncbi:Friend virus susceptibility protein 1-like [Dunckerocampus dactyliophorus]|uniref:Friend virus susceptibility protein 1-like n=1 Tax=Dunckerocampus dactyliophorus TaxID=161453 RepID=UPI0024056592|nr:Friend virus susceptibility protein 1-like [Dunckerocampus dactyliophorus]